MDHLQTLEQLAAGLYTLQIGTFKSDTENVI